MATGTVMQLLELLAGSLGEYVECMLTRQARTFGPCRCSARQSLAVAWALLLEVESVCFRNLHTTVQFPPKLENC